MLDGSLLSGFAPTGTCLGKGLRSHVHCRWRSNEVLAAYKRGFLPYDLPQQTILSCQQCSVGEETRAFEYVIATEQKLTWLPPTLSTSAAKVSRRPTA